MGVLSSVFLCLLVISSASFTLEKEATVSDNYEFKKKVNNLTFYVFH